MTFPAVKNNMIYEKIKETFLHNCISNYVHQLSIFVVYVHALKYLTISQFKNSMTMQFILSSFLELH